MYLFPCEFPGIHPGVWWRWPGIGGVRCSMNDWGLILLALSLLDHPICLTLALAMASSYPPPLEGSAEVKEGFLCPLCLKDLQSFYQLQDHYEEEHSGEERHVRGQIKSKWPLAVFLSLMLAIYLMHSPHSSLLIWLTLKLKCATRYAGEII